jgi:hypothetical protein
MELVVRGGDQGGVVVLGEAAALVAPVAVDSEPVEDVAAVAGFDADHAGDRVPAASTVDPNGRGVPLAGPGGGHGWAQRLAGFVLEGDPRSGRRR